MLQVVHPIQVCYKLTLKVKKEILKVQGKSSITYVDMQHPCRQQEGPCFLVSMDTDYKQDSTCCNQYHRLLSGTYTDCHPAWRYKHNPIHCLAHYIGSKLLPQLLSQHSDAIRTQIEVNFSQLISSYNIYICACCHMKVQDLKLTIMYGGLQ